MLDVKYSYLFGECILFGMKCSRRKVKAMEWHFKPAKKGNKDAVGICYSYGSNSKWCKRLHKSNRVVLSQKKDNNSMYNVGECIRKGGIAKNYAIALEWYLKKVKKIIISSLIILIELQRRI